MLTNILLFGQTFTGNSIDNIKRYDCFLRINKDSTINFVYSLRTHGIYGEYLGTIKQLKDTLYHISATMTIGQFYIPVISVPWFEKDTICLQLDSSVAREFDTILYKYSDGTQKKQTLDKDMLGKPYRLFKIPVNKNIFNSKMNVEYITITTNRKDIITGKLLTFKVPYGLSTKFTHEYKLDFEIVIKAKQLWTIGQAPLQTGHLRMKMEKEK